MFECRSNVAFGSNSEVSPPPQRVRSTLRSRHRRTVRCGPLRARSGHSIASSVLRTGLFGQPRFPKTLNQQLYVFAGPPGDKRRYCKGGIDLKRTRRRVVRLSVTSEMGEGGREAAASWHIGGILTKGFLQYDDRLVKATKLK